MKNVASNRRTFLKGAAAALGGIGLTQWAATNFEAAAEGGQAYVIVADVIRGSGGNPTGPGCTQTSLFVRGEQAVWRAVVYDAETGELVNTAEAVASRGLTMKVTPEGQAAIDMGHGQHPPASRNPAPENIIFYWTGVWEIPPSVTGKLVYTLEVADSGGKTGVLQLIGNKEVDTFPLPLTVS